MTMTRYKIKTTVNTIVNYVLSDNTAFFSEICSKLFVHVLAAWPNAIITAQRRTKTWNKNTAVVFLLKSQFATKHLPGVSTTVSLNLTPCSSMHNVFFSICAVWGGSGIFQIWVSYNIIVSKCRYFQLLYHN